jgi:hypothetical protein
MGFVQRRYFMAIATYFFEMRPLRCPSDYELHELEKRGLIITPNKSDHDILIGLFQPVTEMSESLRQIKNKVDDQKKSCKSRIR